LFPRNTATQPPLLLELLTIEIEHGGAVTEVLLRVAGSVIVVPAEGPAPELLLLLLLALLLEPTWTTQGGTMILVRLLLLGSRSWFCGWPCFWVWGEPAPPGLSRTVLDFSAFFMPPPTMQGWIATVWSTALFGTTI